MATIGQLVGGVITGSTEPEARPHRVTLSVMTFAEIEVMAVDRAQAEALALARVGEAKRKFRTAPAPHRTEIRCLVDRFHPERGSEWVEVDQAGR